jgi:hypothetical protein
MADHPDDTRSIDLERSTPEETARKPPDPLDEAFHDAPRSPAPQRSAGADELGPLYEGRRERDQLDGDGGGLRDEAFHEPDEAAPAAEGTAEVVRHEPSLEELSAAARAPDRNDLTVAGRSLTKHAAGQRGDSSAFPGLEGGPEEINDAAHAQVDQILQDPGTVRGTGYRGRFGETIEFDAPDGRGLVYDRDGNFLFFKE